MTTMGVFNSKKLNDLLALEVFLSPGCGFWESRKKIKWLIKIQISKAYGDNLSTVIT